MDKREKVIKGLECCKVKACIYSIPEIECPYEAWRGEYESAAEECTTMLASDALELLKAQEPRVMALEEAQGADYCWCETRAGGVCVLVDAVISPRTGREPLTWMQTMGTGYCGFHYDAAYGKEWRCWDKEPTKEQREATPWEKN